jgi:hypothetical protein
LRRTLLFGLAPALNSGKVDLIRALKETAGSTTGALHGRWFTLGNSLVVFQMTLTVIVLMGAGLLLRTLVNLKSVGTGFDPNNLLIFDLNATYSTRVGEHLNSLGPELREQLSGLPGVSSVSYSFMAPMKLPPANKGSESITFSNLGQDYLHLEIEHEDRNV